MSDCRQYRPRYDAFATNLCINEQKLLGRPQCAFEQVIELWSQFKTLGANGLRLDRASEDRIRTSFPKLKDFGGVLDVLAPQERSPAQQTDYVKKMEQIAGVRRGPTRKRIPAERKRLLGRGLFELVEAFRRLMIGDSRVLHLAGLRSKFFGQSERDIVAAITLVMRINTNSPSDGPPVDFSAAMVDVRTLQLHASVKSELARVKTLLEDSPTILLAASAPEKVPRLTVRLKPPECTLDGKTYDLSEEAAAVLQALVDAEGRPITEKAISEKYPILAEMKKMRRIVEKMPTPIQSLIHSHRGAGWWIELS